MEAPTLALTIFFLPLVGFTILALFHNRLPRHGDWLATGTMGAGLLLSMAILLSAVTADEPYFHHWTMNWLPVSGVKWIQVGVLVDGLTAIMLFVVTLVSFLVHLFSTKYLEDDVRYGRYFASLQIFSMSMLGLVLADNLLLLFVFWELVGLSSYILIGHWYEKKSASDAAIKAFITTRIGDVGMLIGILICYWQVGSLEYSALFRAAADGAFADNWQTWAAIGLFFGAMGKSAQFPFHVWLPDAMEGPTPVSALIHAATMVAAGVYLVGRLFPIFTPEAFLFVAYIGGITALFAATIATVQDDIKRVLAYSTLSQLGYMVMALGVGGFVTAGYAAGLFHLTTHAFFKAGLFLGSGSVIYAMHHEQRMSRYGGLWSKMPVTGTTYLICVLAISGIFPLAGFFSKDAILAAVLQFSMDEPAHWFLAFSGFLTAFLTAYYMFRQFFLTFTGKPRDAHTFEHAKESPRQITIPLMVLSGLAICAGWFSGTFEELLPGPETEKILEAYDRDRIAKGELTEREIAMLLPAMVVLREAQTQEVEPLAEGQEEARGEEEEHHGGAAHYTAMGLSILLASLGIWVAWLAFYQKPDGTTRINPETVKRRIGPIHGILWNKYFFDEIYNVTIIGTTMVLIKFLWAFDRFVIDGIVNLVGLLGVVFGKLTGLFDSVVVDKGGVDGTAWVAAKSGDLLSLLQTGRVRNYLLFISGGVVCVALILIVRMTLL